MAMLLMLIFLFTMLPISSQERSSSNGTSGEEESEAALSPRLSQLPNDFSRQILHMEDYMPFPGDEYLLLIDFGATEGGANIVEYPLILQNNYTIEIPIIGSLDAEGLNFQELREAVIQQVKEMMLVQYADFRLNRPAPFEVIIYGSVFYPGWTRAHSFTRLTEIIGYAGGFTENGSKRRVRVTSDERTKTYDLLDFYTHGDSLENPYVRPGDKIFIPEIEKYIEIDGAVVKPGLYEILPDEKLEDILALAGGLEPAARIGEAYALRLGKDEGYRQLNFSTLNKEPFQLVLKSGDKITIPSAVDAQEKVIVEGAIYGKPQKGDEPREVPTASLRFALPYRPGLTLLGALKQIGGPTPFAEPENSFILRSETGERIPVPALEEIWDGNDTDKNIPLLPGDYLVIPITNMNVLVTGEVVSGGSFGYIKGYTVGDYIERARGINPDRGSLSKIYIVTADRVKRKVDLDAPVKPGDHILVGKNLWAGSQKAFSNIFVVTGWAAGIIGVATSLINFIVDTLPKVTR